MYVGVYIYIYIYIGTPNPLHKISVFRDPAAGSPSAKGQGYAGRTTPRDMNDSDVWEGKFEVLIAVNQNTTLSTTQQKANSLIISDIISIRMLSCLRYTPNSGSQEIVQGLRRRSLLDSLYVDIAKVKPPGSASKSAVFL